MTLRPIALLLTAAAAAALLAGCGSDTAGGGPSSSKAGSSAAVARKDSAAGGASSTEGPCSLTDRATVASVFTGAGEGRPGQSRNCEYRFASGPVQAVNVYLYEQIDLAQFEKQAKDNGIRFSRVSVGDGAIRDQLHTLTVQQGDTLFSVQALPRAGVAEAQLAPFDPQTLALAKKIAADR